MTLLEKINKVYGKYLFIIIPLITIFIAIYELALRVNSTLVIIAHIILAIVSGMFSYWYILGEKKNIIYFLIQINQFYYAMFLFISKRIVIPDMYGFVFICIGVFMLFFILGLNKNYYSN